MTLGNLTAIGPVTVDYRMPSLRWTSAPTSHGIRSCSISGTVTTAQGDQLAELVNDPSGRQTIGGFTGILEYLTMTGDAIGAKQGYYLLESLDLEVQHQLVFADRVAFTLNAAYLGDAT